MWNYDKDQHPISGINVLFILEDDRVTCHHFFLLEDDRDVPESDAVVGTAQVGRWNEEEQGIQAFDVQSAEPVLSLVFYGMDEVYAWMYIPNPG